MKIGVTERGDAGIDFSWKDKSHTVDGMILITKAINNAFLRHLFSLYEKSAATVRGRTVHVVQRVRQEKQQNHNKIDRKEKKT